MKGMSLPDPSGIAKVRKRYGLGPNDPLSASQFREAYRLSGGGKKAGAAGGSGKQNFSFRFELIELSEDRVRLVVYGRHISKNQFDSMGLGNRIRYRSAFKRAARDLWVLERERLRRYPVMRKARVSYLFVSHHSRDYDNNGESIKPLQDSLIRLGLIEDDNRRNLLPSPDGVKEEVCPRGEEPRIIVTLKRVTRDGEIGDFG